MPANITPPPPRISDETSSVAAAESPCAIPGASPDFKTDLAARLAELAPEAIADGKLDFDKLKELLADDVSDASERFGLFWPGKKRALRAAQAPTTATLKPDFANSKDRDSTQNVFIEGDNLEVLKLLQRHYHNKIKLIYIDPPYNTGKDFVYPDNYVEGLQTYLEWTKQVNEEGKKVSSNPETAGRYHSSWLNMMYPRLKLARNLLADDGVIFISIDDNEVANLRRLCDEVFGEGNFVSQITWRRTDNQPNIGNIARVKDYILCYCKNSMKFKLGKLPLSEKAKNEYRYNDGGRKFRRAILLDKTRGSHTYQVKTKGGKLLTGPWTLKEDDFKKLDAEGGIYWTSGGDEQPYGKIYLDASKGQIPSDLWGIEFGTNQRGSLEVEALFGRRLFDFPKPVLLIKNLVSIGTDNGDIVLDFFAGSATTAHAVMQLNAEDGGNRKFIMVQLPEPTPEGSEAHKAGFATIADISRKRIALAGDKIKADSADKLAGRDTPLDTGFRAYTLADTHFAKWRVQSDVSVNQLEQHLLDLRNSANDNATQDDLLAELLLKMGFPLTAKIETAHIANLEVRWVGTVPDDKRVLACVNAHLKPTLAQLRALVDSAPGKLVMLEDAFHGDDELKTNLHQYARTRGVELWTP